jgi:hypothetical protein
MGSMAETVHLPDDIQRRLDALKAVGGLGLCAIYGWFAILKDTQVPVLVFLDVAVHEIGHKLFSPFGNLIMLIMGTGTQILFPLLAGIAFAIWKGDLVAWGICWAWAASAMCDGGRYIFDAPRDMLMGALAGQVRTVGILTWFVAVGLITYALVRNLQLARASSRAAAAHATAKPSGALAPVADLDMWRR